MLKIKISPILKLKIITPLTNINDKRGNYTQLYNDQIYRKFTQIKFVEDDISSSKKNVLRGLHGDKQTFKLITCLYGKFFLVVVNNNPKSRNYLKSESFTLSDKNRLQILVPPKHANGHYVLSKYTIFSYKQSSYYNRSSQFTLKWNDPKLKINWPKICKKPIISKRDA